jgi:hypothetical protein
MVLTADSILKKHSRLRRLTIRCVRPQNQREPWTRLEDLRLVQMGIYEVVPDGVDNCAMLAHEWKIKSRIDLRRMKRGVRLISYQYTGEAEGFVPRLASAINPVRSMAIRGRE